MERDFKGVWIPKAVWLDERLNALDKVILTEIDSLDQGSKGCYASNKHIAEFCQCSETKVSTAISKLVKLGYLYIQSFDGRKRELKSSLSKFESQPFKNCKADLQNLKDSNLYNNAFNNTDNSISVKADKSASDWFVEFWKIYPNKVKKSAAITAWKSGKCEKIAERIIADVKLRCETEWKGQDIHFVPHPTTYLHQKRWEDDTRPTVRKDSAEPEPRVYKDADYENDW